MIGDKNRTVSRKRMMIIVFDNDHPLDNYFSSETVRNNYWAMEATFDDAKMHVHRTKDDPLDILDDKLFAIIIQGLLRYCSQPRFQNCICNQLSWNVFFFFF